MVSTTDIWISFGQCPALGYHEATAERQAKMTRTSVVLIWGFASHPPLAAHKDKEDTLRY